MTRGPMIPELYSHKVLAPRRAFGRIGRGENVFISSGCAEPQYLVSELVSYCDFLADNEILQFFSLGPVSAIAEQKNDRLRLNSFFIGEASCQAISSGLADYTPAFLSDIPRMLRDRKLKIDVALIQVSPPDPGGNCSFGISVELTKPATEAAHCVIAQVNPRMPKTHGASLIHMDDIDGLVPMEEPLLEWHAPHPSETAIKVGRNVAKLIDDGSTIQVGIGKIPDGILACLEDKKNLGAHTEMFSDSLLDLILCGALDNKEKSLHPGKVVSGLCMGTQKLYDFVNDNPTFEFYPYDYVNDPFIIAQNRKMVSMSSAIEIDLTGQVCANSIGKQFIAGIGAQPEFMRGAKRSDGGKSIIAIPSTACDGRVSRITLALSPGAGVIATRGDVQYVVTEYGISNLEGKCIRERALSLIEIAHPKFRHELLEQAKKSKYIFDDQSIPPTSEEALLQKWEGEMTLKDGIRIRMRPVRPSDERAIQKFKYSLSDEDVFLRFMSMGMRFSHATTLPLTIIDCTSHMAIVAVTGSPGSEDIVGISRYYTNPTTQIAEVAFTVSEKWRRRGVGTALLRQLTKIAREHDIQGFRAEILAKNRAMMRLFHKSECTIHSSYEDDLFTMWYHFDV
jgi:acyl-CoA hydrolase/GNAT superfamily N-acetyltransferase